MPAQKFASTHSLNVHNFPVHDRGQRASLLAPDRQALWTAAGVDNQLHPRRGVLYVCNDGQWTRRQKCSRLQVHMSRRRVPRSPPALAPPYLSRCAFRSPSRNAGSSSTLTRLVECARQERNDAFRCGSTFRMLQSGMDPNSHQQVSSQPRTPRFLCISILADLLTGIRPDKSSSVDQFRSRLLRSGQSTH